MNKTREFLQLLQQHDIKVWVEQGKLKYKAAKQQKALLAELLPQLKAHKDNLMVLLQQPVEPEAPLTLPLSLAQQRLWYLANLDSAQYVYNEFVAFTVAGLIDLKRLNDAIKQVVGQHQSLRTVFTEQDGVAQQKVLGDAAITAKVITSSNNDYHSLYENQKRQPFDLFNGPLFRVCCVQNSHETLLIFGAHHIVFDAWSMAIVIKDLCSAYSFYGQPLHQPVRYSDHSSEQRSQLESGFYQPHQDYWAKQLKGCSSLMPFVSDKPRPPQQQFEGKSVSFEVGAPCTGGLENLAKANQASLFMVLLSALGVLLARYANQNDVIIGTPVANRDRPELESLVGFLVNVLPLRLDCNTSQSFNTLVQNNRNVCLDAFEFQALPFEQIAKAGGVLPNAGHSPLFQVLLDFQNVPNQTLSFDRQQASLLQCPETTAKFDLTLSISKQDGGLSAKFNYNTSLFLEDTINALKDHFITLLDGIVANPEAQLCQLSLVNEQQREHLNQLGQGAKHTVAKTTVVELFEQQVNANPDAPALYFDNQTLSYRILNERANQLAVYLRSVGVQAETLVAVCLPRSIEMIVALLGIIKSGGAYLPLDPNHPKQRIRYVLDEAKVELMITRPDTAERFEDMPVKCIDIKRSSTSATDNLNIDIKQSQLAYVIYTSGSTGTPKGVMIEHLSLRNYLDVYPITPHCKVSLTCNYVFDVSVSEIFTSLVKGCQLFIPPIEIVASPAEYARFLHRHQVAHCYINPMHIRQLAEHLATFEHLYLQHIMVGAEPIKTDSVRWYVERNVRVFNGYGPTESTIFTTWEAVSGHHLTDEAALLPIGLPLGNLDVYLLDDNMDPVPRGVSGQLYIGGSGLSRGYLNQPALTAARFVTHPDDPKARLYHSGDMAHFLPNGHIQFDGRIDTQVKINGHRIELGEIEAALGRVADINEAVVTTQEDKLLRAYLVLAQETKFNLAALKSHLVASLPGYMVPQRYYQIPQVPLNSSGKVDFKALAAADLVALGSNTTTTQKGELTDVQQVLLFIWQELLPGSEMGLQDNFFELGGDSIIAFQVAAKAKAAGWQIQAKDLFLHSTIEALALVAKPVEQQQQSIVVSGPLPSTPIYAWWFDQQLAVPNHFNQSLLLKVSKSLTGSQLNQMLNQLLLAHPLLRLRLEQNQLVVDADYQINARGVSEYQLADLTTQQSAEQLLQQTAQLQASHNLVSGELLQMGLFHLGRTEQYNRLFISIHHLATDGVSWRILLADIALMFDQLQNAEPLNVPQTGASFFDWANRLRAFADTDVAAGQLPYWQATAKDIADCQLSTIAPNPDNSVSSGKTVTLDFDRRMTQQLLNEIHRAFNTNIEDVLLTALVMTLGQQLQLPSVAIDLESHGRNEFDALDVSRTVGWFTSLYPVVFETRGKDVAASLRQVKEQLRTVPDDGVGYGIHKYLLNDEQLKQAPKAGVCFNYLGQFGNDFTQAPFHGLADESCGQMRAGQQQRQHALEVGGLVKDGCLSLSWIYSENLHEGSTIAALVKTFEQKLTDIVSCCLGANGRHYTPSDFPLASLTQSTIDSDELFDQPLDNVYPLSPMQAGVYFHSFYGNNDSTYVNQFKLCFAGELDADKLQQSWAAVVERHELLRGAIIRQQNSQPLQVIYPPQKMQQSGLPWTQLDWRNLPEQVKTQKRSEFLADEHNKGIALETPGYYRFALLRLTENHYEFIWTFHQVLLDGWSVGALFAEVVSIYNSLCNPGQPLKLPVVRPFADYIQWLGQQNTAPVKQYWQQKLKGFEQPTRLTMSHDDDSDLAMALQHDESSLHLSFGESNTLSDVAKSCRLSLNTLIQTAWTLLLRQYTRSNDVVFGCAVAGRPLQLSGVESMVGLFINTVPLRVRLDPQQSLLSLLNLVQGEFADSEPYQVNSSLADIQAASELPGGTALFDSIVVFENYPLGQDISALNEQLSITDVQVTERTNYPITVFVIPGQALQIKVAYHRNRFDSPWIGQLLQHFKTLLIQLCGDLQQPVHQCSALDDVERRKLLVDWNNTDKTYSFERNLTQLIDSQVTLHGERTAVVFGDTGLSYRQLKTRSDQLASHIVQQGAQPGARVGVFVERSAQLVVSLLAVLKAGCCYVPLDPVYPQGRISFIVDDADIKVLVTTSDLAAKLPKSTAQLICLDADETAIAQSRHQLRNVDVNNTAYVIYTSGTTGQPKGVCVSHRNLLNFLFAMNDIFNLNSADKLLAVTTVSFDIAGLELYLPLLAGAQVHIGAGDVTNDAVKLGDYLDRHNISYMQATPSTWQLMLIHQWQGSSSLNILVGGEPLPKPLAQALCKKGRQVWNLYGPTETTIWSSCYQVQPQATEQPVNSAEWIGHPIANTQIYLLDETNAPVPLGVAGEICIGGEGVAKGYLNRPDLTAQKFVANPINGVKGQRIYKTGDLGRYLPDGTIEMLGRLDSQVKVRGYRIELGEIEATLIQHPNIDEAAVVVVDPDSSKQLVAYYVGKALDGASLNEYLKQTLPDYMCPQSSIQLEVLPRLPNAKLDRRTLATSAFKQKYRTAKTTKRSSVNQVEKQLLRLWQSVLPEADSGNNIGLDDNFFDLGGHSLLLAQVHHDLLALYPSITMVDLFSYPTIRQLAGHLAPVPTEKAQTAPQATGETEQHSDIAIIGMAGRFPGADNLQQFWQNLSDGIESITDVSYFDESANYVGKSGKLNDIAGFDAPFFAMTPRNAALMDPQHRLFMETAWAAMEDACYVPGDSRHNVGLFAGAGANGYLLNNLHPHQQLLQRSGADYYQVFIQNDKDFLTTRTSYQLNLTGPSVAVQTACSTSLVAVHMAVESLLRNECDMALAGGTAVAVPHEMGYWHHEGMIFSPDGHCRAFDAKAQGTVPGNGVGAVLLKKYRAAQADGDQIYAVIKGSAINNDGAQKIGFTAPSKQRQAAVIKQAQQKAGVKPQDVSYIEAHGTATPLGDPIEIAALTEVFGLADSAQKSCALGALKSNIGHCDVAGGIGGLIKTALSLKHNTLVPSLHFDTANPGLNLESSAFYVNTRCREWPGENSSVKTAGVSSFGVGGTNAHVVLQQATIKPATDNVEKPLLLTLSAKTASALESRIQDLLFFLQNNPSQPLADVAYSLNVGRKAFDHRQFYCFTDQADLMAQLGATTVVQSTAKQALSADKPLAFMFSGQGAQQAKMGYALYHAQPLFKQLMDQCAAIVNPLLDDDIIELIFSPEGGESAKLDQTRYTQPALFVFEYALARLWQSWGIEPTAMIGHSLGELVAACLAGVMLLEDALELVVARGRLIADLPVGSMLVVSASEQELMPLLGDNVSLSGVNAPQRCTVSGDVAAIADFAALLTAKGIMHKPLNVSHAFHSHMLDPMLADYKKVVGKITLNEPQIEFVSTVTGDWITNEMATSVDYWVRQVRQPVRFALDVVINQVNPVLLEIGPDQTLSRLAKQYLDVSRFDQVVPSMTNGIERAVGQLWLMGFAVDWPVFYRAQQRQRMSLPGYPFEHKTYWVEPPNDVSARPAATDISSIFNFGQSQQPLASGHQATHFKAPMDETEQSLVDIFIELLGVERVGVDDDFYLLGGDSLLATRAINLIKQQLNIALPVKVFLQAARITAIAQYIRDHSGAASDKIVALDRQALLPISAAQQRLWFLTQLDGNNTTYNMSGAIKFSGHIDVEALVGALHQVVARHETLRSAFTKQAGKAVLSFRSPEAFSVDFASWPEPTNCLPQDLSKLADKPFDLTSDFLFRATLIEFENDSQTHVLLLGMHHIISDGWSLGILAEDLSKAYRHQLNQGPQLADLPFQFVDYVKWQTTGLPVDQDLAYWQNQLADLPPLLNLPTDYPRPALNTSRGKTLHFSLDSELARQIKRFSQAQGVTPFMVLLSTFAVLLKRYSAQDDFAIGTPVANRHHSDAESLIGLFVNTLVMRMQLDGDLSYAEVLANTQSMAHDAYAHQSLPFESLVEALNPERSLSHSPLFQVMFVLQNTGHKTVFDRNDGQHLIMESIAVNSNVAKFDLSLVMEEGALCGYFEYNTALFNEQTIDNLVLQFTHLLQRICGSGNSALQLKLSQLLSLDSVEKQRLLPNKPKAISRVLAHHTFVELFEQNARQNPAQTALRYQSDSLSYAELAAQTDRLAQHLLLAGISKNDTVGVCLNRSMAVPISFLAVLKAGAVYVPLDPGYPEARLKYVAADCGLNCIIVDDDLLEHPLCQAMDANDSQQVIVINQALATLVENRLEPEHLYSHDAAYLIYTSGSTGQPKGVLNEHAGLVNLAQYQRRLFDVDERSSVLQFSSISFDASVWEMVMAFGCGATLIMADVVDLLPGRALEASLKGCQISHLTLPPSSLQVLDPDKVNLQCVIVAAEPCPVALAQLWSAKGRFFNAYGPTETTVCATVFEYDQSCQTMSIGDMVDNFEVHIVDEYFNQVPAGVAGELLIGGVGLARGYHNRPQLTQQAFIAHPQATEAGQRLYRSGDRARYVLDEKQNLRIELLGRLDQQVKLRGFRVELSEIEAQIASIEAVTESVVVVTGSGHSARLVGHWCACPDTQITDTDISHYLSQQLPGHLVPGQWVKHRQLPTLPNGKVDRKLLQEMQIPQEVLHRVSISPRTPTELMLLQLWQTTLAREDISVTDNFFDVGGQSLLAVQLMAQIEQTFDLTLPAATIFSASTIEQLAQSIDNAEQVAQSCLIGIERNGRQLPIFAVPGVGGHVIGFQPLSAALGDNQPFYGFQAVGLDGKAEPHTTVESMAAHYIEQMRSVQREGPYQLLGHSFGGHIAFEMVRQLLSQGEQVKRLILLDITAPLLSRSSRQNWSEQQWLTALIETIENISQMPLGITVSDLEELDFEQQLQLLSEKLQTTHIMPNASDINWVRGGLSVFKAGWMMNYQPTGKLTIDTLVFRSKVLPGNATEQELSLLKQNTLGWERLIENVECHDVDGDHFQIMLNPYVDTLASIITK